MVNGGAKLKRKGVVDMFKIVAATCLAVAMCSIALADSVQMQGFDLGGLNGAVLSGDGSSVNTNVGGVNNSQLLTNNMNHSTNFQNTAGSLFQVAGAVGMGGLFGVGQTGNAAGLALQLPSQSVQTQALDANLNQEVFKIGGSGLALGLQTFVGIQTQLSFNPYGGSANIQGVGTTVYNAVAGGPTANMTVGGNSTVGAGQNGVN
jgi:catalase (peroxidase I)